MKAKRTILSGLLTHCLPNYSTAEFQVKGQHRCGRPPDRVGSELHEGNLPAAKPLITTPCAHFALTAALPVPPDQLILRKVSVGHRATDPVPAHNLPAPYPRAVSDLIRLLCGGYGGGSQSQNGDRG